MILKTVPKDRLAAEDFKLATAPRPEPGRAEALVRTLYLSLDAASRAWMQGPTLYHAQVHAGEVMHGLGLGEVVASRSPRLEPGDLVEGELGWQEYAACPAKHLLKRTPHDPQTHLLSLQGIAGRTAWVGMLSVGRIKTGQTVVVSAAAGSVGSLAGQIARIKGCRVVGITGSEDKCRWLQTLGFDAAVNHRDPGFAAALRAACPGGIDVYFDNVGGAVLEAVLFQMAPRGRIVCCGAVSQYDRAIPDHGPRGIPGLLVIKRLTMEGFIVLDKRRMYDRMDAELAGWARSGQLRVAEDLLDGLENAPRGLIGLLAGDNRGKRLIKVA